MGTEKKFRRMKNLSLYINSRYMFFFFENCKRQLFECGFSDQHSQVMNNWNISLSNVKATKLARVFRMMPIGKLCLMKCGFTEKRSQARKLRSLRLILRYHKRAYLSVSSKNSVK